MALGETISHSVPLEVYLPFTVIRGTLVTRHDRVSNHLILRTGDEVFSLRNASVEDLNGKPLPAKCEEYLLYMHEVLFIADLSSNADLMRPNLDFQQVSKEPKRALLHVSPFWIRGTVHLIPGAALHDLVMVRNPFIPVTDATLVHNTNSAPCTFLVNRTKISCLAAEFS